MCRPHCRKEEKMKDIPIFTTDNGVASLFLQEIPYRKRAHIKIRSSLSPEAFLDECISFCKMCGADWIDASGHDYLQNYPLITALYQMQCPKENLGATDACLFPLTEETLDEWVRLYNARMGDVPNCAWLDTAQAKKMLADGDCYFVHRNGALIGFGSASDGMLHTVAAVERGMGQTAVCALATLLDTDTVTLNVASENKRAFRLYEKMGFVITKELTRWYRVL